MRSLTTARSLLGSRRACSHQGAVLRWLRRLVHAELSARARSAGRVQRHRRPVRCSRSSAVSRGRRWARGRRWRPRRARLCVYDEKGLRLAPPRFCAPSVTIALSSLNADSSPRRARWCPGSAPIAEAPTRMHQTFRERPSNGGQSPASAIALALRRGPIMPVQLGCDRRAPVLLEVLACGDDIVRQRVDHGAV